MTYLSQENKTGKEVEWFVDLSCLQVMAKTADEAAKIALERIEKEGIEICNIELVEYQNK